MAAEWRLLVEKIKRLAVPSGREALGEFTLEGHRSMERALRNGAPLKEVLISESFAQSEIQREREIRTALKQHSIPVEVAPDDEVHALTKGRRIGEVFGVMSLPSSASWKTFFSGEGRRVLVVGWNIADPGNTGAMIRTALASGAIGFLAVGTTDPWHPKAVRTSMGSLFKLPIMRVEETSAWMSALKTEQVQTFATTFQNAEDLPGLQSVGNRVALILGSEAFGLPDEVAARCDRRVRIPMPEGVDSFSVNAATAILSYTLVQAE